MIWVKCVAIICDLNKTDGTLYQSFSLTSKSITNGTVMVSDHLDHHLHRFCIYNTHYFSVWEFKIMEIEKWDVHAEKIYVDPIRFKLFMLFCDSHLSCDGIYLSISNYPFIFNSLLFYDHSIFGFLLFKCAKLVSFISI